jgi:beta-lactam-binding protein with PASTA domain
MKALGSVLVLLCLAGGLAACGGGEATTETQEAQESAAEAERETLELKKETAEREAEKAKAEARKEAKRAQRAAAESEPEPEPEPEAETAEVPNVVGMRLPAARSTLKAAGYRTQAENTDTSFGIVIPSHFTVCEQSEPHGKVVTVLAQKYGC